MNMPVLVDWVSVVLCPVIVVAGIAALTARRRAAKAGTGVPGWAKAANGVCVVCALLVGALWMIWDH